jgi:hypothetical protein
MGRSSDDFGDKILSAGSRLTFQRFLNLLSCYSRLFRSGGTLCTSESVDLFADTLYAGPAEVELSRALYTLLPPR